MKKIMSLLVTLCVAGSVFASPVSREQAKQIALNFYTLNNPSGIIHPEIRNINVQTMENVTTFYVFTFTEGGFIIVAADDASVPILGYSFENEAPEDIECPATKAWLNGYSMQIAYIIKNRLDNAKTLALWKKIRNGTGNKCVNDVGPLLTTVWGQGCYYNQQCPYDPAATSYCNHVLTGCATTAMVQIMKYHNFPPKGVGVHTYTHPVYGELTADFGNTNYDWTSMPNGLNGQNNAIAMLNFHAAVALEINFGPTGSNGQSYKIPQALIDYFNYDPGARHVSRYEYPDDDDWKNLLRADLDQSLPVYYGSQAHAFVCDGYNSDGFFHFNWGWLGSANGWYEIGNLNPSGLNCNTKNKVVVHIKPYNPDLIVRISHPVDYDVFNAGQQVEITASVVRGTPQSIKILIDGVEKATSPSNNMLFTWSTTDGDQGSHVVTAVATSGNVSVVHKITVNVSKWHPQPANFNLVPKEVISVSAVDTNVLWAIAKDEFDYYGRSVDFSHSVDGGNTWNTGHISTPAGLVNDMICAVDTLTAYILNHKMSGTSLPGIWVTTNGGNTWLRQTAFNNTSYPDCIHFFNASEGWCMGDPNPGQFEIYTTTNGGNVWELVPAANIPSPSGSEYGYYNSFSIINDTIWFGTNKGRVYRSVDKGYHWTVSFIPGYSGSIVKPSFQNGKHGLAAMYSYDDFSGKVWETFDGGVTWGAVNYSGTMYYTDLRYVPGTENTWVSSGGTPFQMLGRTGFGCSFSFDGGHSWTDFPGTQGTPFTSMIWFNNHCGWAGGINTDTDNGIFRYKGLLIQLPAPMELQADVINQDVHLSWNAPVNPNPSVNLVGYNMYRDGCKLNSNVIEGLTCNDTAVVPGEYLYSVKAVYNAGESFGDSVEVNVFQVGVNELRITNYELRITNFPNPVVSVAIFQYELQKSCQVRLEIFDSFGRKVAEPVNRYQTLGKKEIRWNAGGVPMGIYYYRFTAGDVTATGKMIKE